MYALELETEFSAAHALTLKGARERVHGHDFRVRVTVAGAELDPDGLLCDFHLLERELAQVIRPFRNVDLNATPPFDRVNPSAEQVAKHLADALATRLPKHVQIESVRVTEAPGCAATYRPRHLGGEGRRVSG